MNTRTPYDIDKLNMAIMNIPCKKTLSHFATVAEAKAYGQGHRAARHAAVELLLEYFKNDAEPSVAADERALFEAKFSVPEYVHFEGDGHYHGDTFQDRGVAEDYDRNWQVWQARAALARAPLPAQGDAKPNAWAYWMPGHPHDAEHMLVTTDLPYRAYYKRPLVFGDAAPAQAGDVRDAALAEHYRSAIAVVCEGWTLPACARKVLETAMWTEPAAMSASQDTKGSRDE
jgi:hypothetical protein